MQRASAKIIWFRRIFMDIKQLAYFMAIAEEGNISAAAKKLHISQPPLSLQLKLLEEELGTVLIERGPRRSTLTDAGRLLYKHASYILQLMRTAKKELEDFESGIQGTLRLGTISSSGTFLLSHRMRAFHKRSPNIRFEIHEGNTFQMLDFLATNIIELAVVRTPFLADNVACYHLDEEPMVAVADRELLADIPGDTISLALLKDKPIIYYRRYESLLPSVFHDYGIKPNVFCENDDARTSLLWAKAALGVAIVPKGSVDMIQGDNLLCKVLDEPRLYTRVTLIHRKNAVLSTPARGFVEFFCSQEHEGTS